VVSVCWGGFAGGRVGVDRTTSAELSSVQIRCLFELDDHITIRLPPLLTDVSLQMLGESGRGQVWISAYLLMVGHTEGNYVFIRGQNAATAEGADSGLRFAAQQGLDLLRDDRSAENAGERIADGGFELALDAVHQTHVTARLTRRRHVVAAHAGGPPRVGWSGFFLHGIYPRSTDRTNETLRITSGQVSALPVTCRLRFWGSCGVGDRLLRS
jgi:hypothetical protein